MPTTPITPMPAEQTSTGPNTGIGLLVLETFPEDVMARLRKSFDVHSFTTLEAVQPYADSIRAIATGGGPGVPPALMAMLPNLQIIAVNGVGTDAIDLGEAEARGIRVTTTAGLPTSDVADLAMALTLDVKRNILPNDRFMREGRWREGPPPLSSSLTGCRMGIAGFGQIGQAIGRRAQACEMEVGYFSRRPVQENGKPSPLPYFPDILSLASWADVLMLVVPGGPATRGMVNAEVLKALGPNGYLVNVARGSVVDEPALIEALRHKTIRAAGLDVFWNEPDINPAFFTLENTVLQPHQGSATVQTRQKMGDNVIENLLNFFAGKPLLTPLV
ncbi:2-hydroxyacid dehydrogenase [Oecophyllibacter saccharovorans]|uniref:2-hydroxyacid dehydrogenase n=1 Tax=Oecophyllibacter saccharovorans TaxID=2558360 RepID=UPI001E6075BC|nr:2-hydroxyacid dehydrogenase [Oecophyllibacter saccharovorans]